ncbi:hypothetical protein AAE478_001726 [Parahypoxylon ruwenzoriense]
MTGYITAGQHDRISSTQPGSMPKKWDKEELRRSGAVGTTKRRALTLRGAIHPVFSNWADADPELRAELEQPLLLASRVLVAAGLPWTSDFLAHDVFAGDYPGRAPSCRCSFTHSASAPVGYDDGETHVPPPTIVRYHHHAASSPREREEGSGSGVKDGWLHIARAQLEGEVAHAITWQLDPDMFARKGWVGYTCRHPRRGMPLAELDRFETIRLWDRRDGSHDQADSGGDENGDENRDGRREGRGRIRGRCRDLTVLVAAEFPARLVELRKRGKEHEEEYLLTAFMAAVTILHELGHAVYWQDRRALTRDLREPFYGGDLEMELGDSFVASVFGGWLPVPVGDITEVQGRGWRRRRRGKTLSFEDGLAWKQSLTRLFSKECWVEARDNPARDLVRPRALMADALRELGIWPQAAEKNQHATAAIADFHCAGEGWMWNRLPGARFRIPQYDGYLCPDMDLPIATDDVIEEPRPQMLADTAATESIITTRIEDSGCFATYNKPHQVPVREARRGATGTSARDDKTNNRPNNDNNSDLPGEYSEKNTTCNLVRPSKAEPVLSSNPDKSEISLDELRIRLSQLLGVSLCELEELFEASRCA